jgi:hypothetical protein
MDADGIRNGSTTNERTKRTIKITGKNERANSTILGSTTDWPGIRALRLALNKRLSAIQIKPAITNAITNSRDQSADMAAVGSANSANQAALVV